MAKKYRKKIDPKVSFGLWLRAGGRCQFPGCNKPLWRNNLTMVQLNESNIAHINSYNKANRWDESLSDEEKNDISNLMLMCYDDHKLIDSPEQEEKYNAETLRAYKKRHENRIEILSGHNPEVKSHIVFFGSKIGQKNSFIDFNSALDAMLPNYFPANSYPIELGINGGGVTDSSQLYWEVELESLIMLFNQLIKPIYKSSPNKHISLFAIAPQPLLIKLGSLFSEINNVEVFQKSREKQDWSWHEESAINFAGHYLIKPKNVTNTIALNLSLSGTITDDRIYKTLGKNTSVWTITHKCPINTYMKSKEILNDFKNMLRRTIDQIKRTHGESGVIILFPAVPVSAAVSIGLTRMPKADLPLVIYEQLQSSVFLKTYTIY